MCDILIIMMMNGINKKNKKYLSGSLGNLYKLTAVVLYELLQLIAAHTLLDTIIGLTIDIYPSIN